MRNGLPAFVFLLLNIVPVLYGLSAGPESDTAGLIRSLTSAAGLERVRMLNKLAASVMENNSPLAKRYANEALLLNNPQPDLKEKARTLFILAEASYFDQAYQDAIHYYLASAGVEKEAGGIDSRGYIERIGDAGHTYTLLDQHAEALCYLQESLGLSLKNGIADQAASMYSNIGVVYVEWGDYAKALEYTFNALEIDKRMGSPEQIAISLNNIGKIYEQWLKYDEAITFYKESLHLADSLHSKPMIAVRLNNLGLVCKSIGQYSEALDYLRKALKIEEELGDRKRIGKRHLHIISVFLEMEDLDQCGLYIGKAFTLIDTSAHSENAARLDHLAGRYYLKRNDPRRAIESFSRSLQYAEKFQLKPLEADNLKLLSEAHEKTGDPRTSLGCLKSYLILKEEMFREESDEKMAEFHARYQNEQVRLENEMLRQDARSKMNLFITGGIVLLVLILLLLSVIFLLRLRAKNARQSKIMAEQHTRAVEMELELRNKELTCNAITIIKKNETVAEIVETLEKEFKLANTPNVPGALIEKVRNLDKDAGWKEFEMRFTQVHQDFYERLHERFPDLTPNERKLCAFLRLNMSTKDIASITRQSVHSINVARTRMRKKLGLANSEENLIAFLSTI